MKTIPTTDLTDSAFRDTAPLPRCHCGRIAYHDGKYCDDHIRESHVPQPEVTMLPKILTGPMHQSLRDASFLTLRDIYDFVDAYECQDGHCSHEDHKRLRYERYRAAHPLTSSMIRGW